MNDVEQLEALRAEFPGWQIRHHDLGAMDWDAVQLQRSGAGGIVLLVAAEPEYLRELLTAANEINARRRAGRPS